MRNYLTYKTQKKPAAPNEILKVTALIYLEDALEKEEFEQCPELIQKAQYFGAGRGDVQKILAKYARKAQLGPNYTPYKKKGKGRF